MIPSPRREDRVVVPVAGIDRAVVQAVNLGRSIGDDVRAVVIEDEPERALALRDEWDRRFDDVPLDIVESPYRDLGGPVLAYLDWLDEAWPTELDAPVTFVIVPEFVPRHWWERPLYNQTAKSLRAALVGRPHTVVVDMPYRRQASAAHKTLPNPATATPKHA